MVLWEFKLKTREYFRENFVAHMNLMVERCFGEGGAAGGGGWRGLRKRGKNRTTDGIDHHMWDMINGFEKGVIEEVNNI